MTSIARTIEINDLRPEELAVLFCDMSGEDQAVFFGELWTIARKWPGAGWCQQSHSISEHLDSEGREAIRVLASHALDEPDAPDVWEGPAYEYGVTWGPEASVDTHPKGGDSEAAPAPLSSAVPLAGDAQ